MDGLELQRIMAERQWLIPVIIMTAYAQIPMAVRAMHAGAVDFIEKPFKRQKLLTLIHQAIELNRKNRSELARLAQIKARVASLTRRELEVMYMVVGGRTTKQIAKQLVLSARTVDVHRARLMKKMMVRSQAELGVLFTQGGFQVQNEVVETAPLECSTESGTVT